MACSRHVPCMHQCSITMGAGSSMSAAPQHRDAAARPSGTLTAIPESKTKTLLERIQAIEQLIPGEMERLRAGALPAAVESGAATGTVSTRSAPEGSLLARVEVLEEALDTLLQAQAALIAQQKATEAELEAERNRNKQPKSSRACCVVM